MQTMVCLMTALGQADQEKRPHVRTETSACSTSETGFDLQLLLQQLPLAATIPGFLLKPSETGCTSMDFEQEDHTVVQFWTIVVVQYASNG